MNLATFVERSEGQWRSMRSGHSLAFQQFEEVLSQISIQRLKLDDERVQELIQEQTAALSGEPEAPFLMEWSAESDWEPDDPNDVAAVAGVAIEAEHESRRTHVLLAARFGSAVEAAMASEALMPSWVLSLRCSHCC